jgi:hypothetical protein
VSEDSWADQAEAFELAQVHEERVLEELELSMREQASIRQRLYLDLLKRTLTGMVYEDPPIVTRWHTTAAYQEKIREIGYDWPQHAPCMIGLPRLDNVQHCVEQVLADNVPGDLAEAGVWRGGTTIFMRELLKLYDVTDRDVWVIDSFAGLPMSAADKVAGGWILDSGHDPLAVPLEEVKHNFELYGCLDEHVRFLQGWFRDTLPAAPIGPLAVLRLDGDLYESQRDVLVNLYPKLSPGGFVIIDDPQLEGCARAIREYRQEHDITETMLSTGSYALYWRKT